MEQENLTEAEIRARILSIDEKIEEELTRQDADMTVVDDYLRQIRDLCGNTYQKSEAELEAELQAIYAQAAQRKKKQRFWQYSSVGRRVAGLAAALLVAFGCSMTVSAVRTPFVNFAMNIYDKFTEFFFDKSDIEKAPSTIETVYTLGYVPEGYELNSQSTEIKNTVFIWQNKNGGSIELSQNTLEATYTIDTEDTEQISFADEQQVFFKKKFGKQTYFWNTNEYQFWLYIEDDDISAEDGMELIRSIIKYEK